MAQNSEPWVDSAVVAQHLNKPISWIHQNADRLGIPRRRLGRHLRFRLSEIDAWLMDQQ